jgi:hypothetical protein
VVHVSERSRTRQRQAGRAVLNVTDIEASLRFYIEGSGV